MNKIINGNLVSNIIKKKIKILISNIIKKGYRNPTLAIIILKNNFISKIYLKNKIIECNKVGIKIKIFKFIKKRIKIKKILNLIDKLNKNVNIDGIIIHLPIPKYINKENLYNKIVPFKDIDGFNLLNMISLLSKNKKTNLILNTCTSRSIITLLNFYNIKINNFNIVVIGTSDLIGKPIGLELLKLGCCTITFINKKSKNKIFYTKNADLLISAVGKANYINRKWIKERSIIIDVGINKVDNGKITGDVNFNDVYSKVSYITPVPGGVGPVNIAMIIKNTFLSYKYIFKKI